MPRGRSAGFRHHESWAFQRRAESITLGAFALGFLVGAICFWLHEKPLHAGVLVIVAVGLSVAVHGSWSQAQWHAKRRNLHAAAAGRKGR